MQVKAFLLVQTAFSVNDVRSTLETIPGVEVAHHVTGPYDVVAIVSASEWTALELIADEIRNVPGVARAIVAPTVMEALGQQGAMT